MKRLLLTVVLCALCGCLSIHREAVAWSLKIVNAEGAAVAGAAVVIAIRDGEGKVERFGPATTDGQGLCRIDITEQRFPVLSKHWKIEGLWFEIEHKGRRSVEREFTGFERGFVIRVVAEEPNQSLEPTPTAGTSAAEQPLVPAAVVAHL